MNDTTERQMDFVDRSMNFKAIVDGDAKKFRLAKTIVETARMMLRRMDSFATMVEVFTSVPKIVSKTYTNERKDKKTGKIKTTKVTYDSVHVDLDKEAVKELMCALLDRTPAKWYSNNLRTYWNMINDRVEETGGFRFNSRIFDTLVKVLKGLREKSMPDRGKISRNILVASGCLDLINVRHTGLPFMRYIPTGTRRDGKPNKSKESAIRAECLSDGKGKKDKRYIRLRYGGKEDYLDFVVNGVVKTTDGREYSHWLDTSQRRLFDQFILGHKAYRDCELNFNESNGKIHFRIRVSYRMPVKTDLNLRPDSVVEVSFNHKLGSEMPRRRREKPTDQDKTYIIHVCCGERRFSIPVDDVIDLLNTYGRKADVQERQRDCRARMRGANTEVYRRRVNSITKKRTRLENHRNHSWAKDIIGAAVAWGCGTVRVFGPPSGLAGLTLDGSLPWGWADFLVKIKEKAEVVGIKVQQRKVMKLDLDDIVESTEEVSSLQVVAS